jgi:hypothetical protein
MVSINRPATMARSYLNGAISIRDIYGPILKALQQSQEDTIMCHLFPETLFSGIGLGTALSGGETRGLKNHRTVAVSGVRDTIRVLDQVEAGLLKDVDLLECMVCPDGCVGGPLAIENRFLGPLGRRQQLARQPSLPLFQHHVRKRAADIDGNAQIHDHLVA